MPTTIAEYRRLYAEADGLLQEVQSFRNEAGIPAINELRNAGHHLIQAIDDEGRVGSTDALVSGVGHTRRAIYEATEAGIVFAVGIVRKFQLDFADIEVGDLLENYAGRCRECNDALRLIEAGRRSDFDRTQDHLDRVGAFRTIRPFAEDAIVARDEANKRLGKERRDTRRHNVTVVLGILAIVVTIIAAAVTGRS